MHYFLMYEIVVSVHLFSGWNSNKRTYRFLGGEFWIRKPCIILTVMFMTAI